MRKQRETHSGNDAGTQGEPINDNDENQNGNDQTDDIEEIKEWNNHDIAVLMN